MLKIEKKERMHDRKENKGILNLQFVHQVYAVHFAILRKH